MHILLAEDNKNLGIVLKNELEQETYTVDLVNNGVEAVLNFVEKHYDIVLLDIIMPKLDGMNALKIIMKLDPTIPAIVFSGNAVFSEIEETLTAGAIRYFQKPFEMADLKECIKNNLLKKSKGVRSQHLT